MPPDVTVLDAFAFAWFVLAWVGYTVVTDWNAHRISGVNHRMREVRRVWMERMIERDNRIFDAQLIGHSINSVTFFASTSVLVLAGLLGVFGAVDAASAVLTESGVAAGTSKAFFELKLLLMVAIFTYGFLKFTWSLRQYNYTCGLLGAVPPPGIPPAERRALAEELSGAMSSAIAAFNAGLRAYYFALAALTWFIQPWLFALATAGVVAVLLRRQLGSPFADTLDRAATLLGGSRPRPEAPSTEVRSP